MTFKISPRKNTRIATVFMLGTIASLGPLTPIHAATTTTTFQVTATVQASCVIQAANLSFGNYSGSQTDATSTLQVTCTNSTPYNIGLNAGTGSGASVSNRKMTLNSTSTLPYFLYSDSARTNNWGNTPNQDTVSGTGNGSAQSLTIYGRIQAGNYPNPGSYADTITVTVNF
ncbi:Protein U precursor [Granulibacter bethesdensis]|uniref:Protein U n=1 Tax=Granulibacter bethesdensis TaxID=364410 RepID=A0AAC9KAB0_9PROT|nr:spore coat U domain-containing protein [Granulibacter bethesdensis]APH54627.1 Protein U precursor [Granulibacter bethesdensis]APH62213.1 Protein U precursor [Granulibacter bethesdensis]